MSKLKKRKVSWLLLFLIGGMSSGCLYPGRDLAVNSGSYSWSSSDNLVPTSITKKIIDRDESEPLTLEESVEIALSNNRHIIVADLDVGIAEDEIRQAFSALMPKLRLNAQRLWRDLPPGGKFGSFSYVIGDKRVDTANARIAIPIYDFGVSTGILKQSKLRRDIAECQARRTRQDVIFDTVKSYFAILNAEKSVQLIEKSVSTLEKQLKLSRDFYEQGLVGKEDVLQSELRLAERNQELIRARNNLDIAISTFNRVLGLEIDRKTKICDVLNPIEFKVPLDVCIQVALENRLDKKELEKQREIAKTEMSVARSERNPKLYATLNYDYTSNSFILPDDFTSATLNAQIDPFKGGEIFAKIRKARKQLQQIDIQLSELDANIALEVKKAYLNLIESKKRIDVSKKAIEQAEENLRIETDKYQQNLVTLTDVLEAETTLLNAHNNYNRSLYDHYIAIAELENAMGTGIYEMQNWK